MKDWLYPGAKVVCVDDHGRHYENDGFSYVRKGRVYSVREVVQFRSGLCILVDEVVNRPCRTSLGYREPGFGVNRFRPLTKRPTDISVFTDLLHDVKRTEPVMLNTPWRKVAA